GSLSTMLADDAELAPVATLLEELAEHAESRRRQIARFGYDLHDGALQEIAALGTELHLFRDQMASTLAGHESEAQLLGRVDDLLARLVDLDTSLRELAVSAESSTLVWRPLSVSVRE